MSPWCSPSPIMTFPHREKQPSSFVDMATINAAPLFPSPLRRRGLTCRGRRTDAVSRTAAGDAGPSFLRSQREGVERETFIRRVLDEDFASCIERMAIKQPCAGSRKCGEDSASPRGCVEGAHLDRSGQNTAPGLPADSHVQTAPAGS